MIPFPDEQARSLMFLKLDLGDVIMRSPLPGHPLAQELELRQGDLLATFVSEPNITFIIDREGGMTPIKYHGED